MLMAGNIIEDIAMHLKGPCMRMHRVCSETLVRISSGPDAEVGYRFISLNRLKVFGCILLALKKKIG